MKQVTLGDLLKIAQTTDINASVHIIATRPGFIPVRGVFVALGKSPVLVLTDHDINADPSAFAGIGVPVVPMEGGE